MPEHRTSSGRLAPYPDMTDEDLDDFEAWDNEVCQPMSLTELLAWAWLGILFIALLTVFVISFITAFGGSQ